MRSFARLLAAAVALAALAGCSHYHLGAPGKPLAETVFVEPAVNASFAPQAAPLVTDATRLALARDGRITLAAREGDSAAHLQIRLVRFERDVLAARHDDTALARKFAARLTAEITLTDRNGRILIDRRSIAATRDVFVDSGLQPTEYQTMPLLAEALGAEIAHALLDTW
ncbi:MAG TPA: LPS assembly lipoprotein LptE [Opitutaceae bacterium]|nr:LPS assembly lipoprotein LptE [Opitutaceae bacterium]